MKSSLTATQIGNMHEIVLFSFCFYSIFGSGVFHVKPEMQRISEE